jgi:prepilin-type N-terminal cleavage/methylation domain-containing protein
MSISKRATRGFTLVELLVVIAIVGVLFSMLLPNLSAARDEARRVRCQANMRQLYNMGGQFRGDFKGNVLPAWYYATRPNGPSRGEVAPNQLGVAYFGWTYRHSWHMLMDYGYLPESNRISPTVATEYSRYKGLARTSILACPDGYAPGGTADDSPADFVPAGVNAHQLSPSPWERKTMMQRIVVAAGYNPPEGMTLGGGGYLTGYNISMHAGSFQFYHDMSVNSGLYPRKEWQFKSAPDRVGYMFESSDFGVNQNHTVTAYSRTANSWSTGWGGTYNPQTPHTNYTRNNLVFLDGHLGQMREDHTSIALPFVWQ